MMQARRTGKDTKHLVVANRRRGRCRENNVGAVAREEHSKTLQQTEAQEQQGDQATIHCLKIVDIGRVADERA
jgi:hypothetical protein